MKACPYCAELIQDAAIKCKHCGSDLTAKPAAPAETPKRAQPSKTGRGCLLIVLILVGLGVIFSLLPSNRSRQPIAGVDPDPPERVAQAREFVAKAEQQGVIKRWTCTGNEAYVSETAWHAFDVDAKRGMTGAMAIICHAKNSGRRMTIYGHQSGKKLATFGAMGFSIE